MELLGVDIASPFIPWRRRMQTLAVLYLECLSFGGGFPCLLLMIYFCFTSYYWIPLIYLVWYCYDKDQCNRGGRPNQWLRSWTLFKYYADYFPIKLIKTADLPPGKNYLIGAHPHGIFSSGHFCVFATEGAGWSQKFPGITPHLCTLLTQFRFPFFRELFMQFGATAATNESLDYVLKKREGGHAMILVVGGAAEALYARPGVCTLVLARRKGFVRAVLRNGADLVPAFSFGENDVLDQLPNPPGSKVRHFQESFKAMTAVSPPLAKGRGIFQYTFGLVPYRKPINIVLGKPIPVERIEYPTEEQVTELHNKYLVSLKELFDTHKAEYSSDPDIELLYV